MMAEKRKYPIEQYNTYVVDMDGTLYFKRPMQIRMALRLLGYYTLHLIHIRELLLLQDYRKKRDEETISACENIDVTIMEKLSAKYHYSMERVSNVITEWIHRRPLDTLYASRDKYLISFLQDAISSGKKVFIYSDYPAADKCEALGMCANGIYWPDGEAIRVLKPESAGLEFIINSNDLNRTNILFIGDRLERDGICAERCGVDYLILKKSYYARNKQYRKTVHGEVTNY